MIYLASDGVSLHKQLSLIYASCAELKKTIQGIPSNPLKIPSYVTAKQYSFYNQAKPLSECGLVINPHWHALQQELKLHRQDEIY